VGGGVDSPPPKQQWSFNDPYSQRLSSLMSESWGVLAAPALPPAPPAGLLAARRDALRAQLQGRPAIVTAGRAPIRNDDVAHQVRSGSDYVYLTGDQTAGGVLVVAPAPAGDDDVLYLQAPQGRETKDFYDDAANGELWVGPRPSLDARAEAFGIACRPLGELAGRLGQLDEAMVCGPAEPALAGLPARDETLAGGDRLLAALISELRLIKDAWELAELRRAIELTIDAYGDVRSLCRDRAAVGEREVEMAFISRARREGNGPGYHPIAAGGAHATTLHWSSNDGIVGAHDLLLLDAGVEVDSLYTGDLTRTWPVGGRFSDTQRRIYEHVLAAEQAAIATLRPGARFRDYYDASARTLAEGLEDLGVLPVSARESLDPECGLHRRWTLCAPGHMLGLDVHDCSRAREETYIGGELRPGMVLTVEPGIYLQANDELVPEAMRGTGVRIEDDILITDDGHEVLSRRLPKTVEDLEEWCRS
jgi:Xaa-Pro aminopeptidase